MDDKLLDKYGKIQALAERGSTEGERATARSKLQALQQANPGIGGAWRARERQRLREKSQAAAPPPAASQKPRAPRMRYVNEPEPEVWWQPNGSSFSDLFNAAESTFRTASTAAQNIGDFASRFTSGVSAYDIANLGSISSYTAQNGAYFQSFSLPKAGVDQLPQLTVYQRDVFKKQVLAAIAEHLDVLLPT